VKIPKPDGSGVHKLGIPCLPDRGTGPIEVAATYCPFLLFAMGIVQFAGTFAQSDAEIAKSGWPETIASHKDNPRDRSRDLGIQVVKKRGEEGVYPITYWLPIPNAAPDGWPLSHRTKSSLRVRFQR
jgi:hypothetical protein